MDYFIFKDNNCIDTIVADEEFIRQYCEENGYTYEKREERTLESGGPEPAMWDQMAAAIQEGVNEV